MGGVDSLAPQKKKDPPQSPKQYLIQNKVYNNMLTAKLNIVNHQDKVISILVSKYPYRNKEEAERWVGMCKKRKGIEIREVTIPQLVELIGKGHTVYSSFVIALPNEKGILTFSDDGFLYTYMFFVDVDNTYEDENKQKKKLPPHQYLPLSECLRMLEEKGLTPTFIYHTFSSTPEHERYRICWVINEPVTDREQKYNLHKKLMSLFVKGGAVACDTSCIDLSRLFYGGNIHSAPGNILSIQEIESLDIHPLIEEGTGSKKKERAAANIHPQNNHGQSQGSGYHLNTPEYWALKQGDPQTLRAILQTKLSNQTRTVNLEEKAYSVLSLLFGCNSQSYQEPLPSEEIVPYVPLHLFLGVELKQKFNCLFHDDKDPSANVFKTKEGKVRYHCFGCEKTLDTVEFIKELNKWSYRKVYEFLGEVIGVELESEWRLNKKKHLLNEGRYIMGDLFKKHYPQVYSYLDRSNAFPVLETLIHFILEHGINMGNDKLCIFLPLSRLRGLMKDKGYKTGIGRTQLHKKIKILCHLGFLDTLADKEIPEEFLKEATGYQKAKGNKYRASFYGIPEWGHHLYQEATEQIEDDKKKHFRKSTGISREKMIRTFGKEEADKHFVQDRDKGRYKGVERFYALFEEKAVEYLTTHGFVYEKDVLNEIKEYKEKTKLRYAETVAPTFYKLFGLENVRVNKKTRKQHRIPENIPSNSIVWVKKGE